MGLPFKFDLPTTIAFFPERFVQGLALEEFSKFPHIIGSINKKSENECKKFLSIFSKDIITMKPEEAEITKLESEKERIVQQRNEKEVSKRTIEIDIKDIEKQVKKTKELEKQAEIAEMIEQSFKDMVGTIATDLSDGIKGLIRGTSTLNDVLSNTGTLVNL